MKHALVDEDNELAGAHKVAREKTRAAESKKEIAELKKQQAEWDDKFKTHASDFEQEKKTLTEKVAQLIQKRTL